MPAKAKPAPKKVRKPRAPMSDEAKQAMLDKRRATLAAKQVASSASSVESETPVSSVESKPMKKSMIAPVDAPSPAYSEEKPKVTYIAPEALPVTFTAAFLVSRQSQMRAERKMKARLEKEFGITTTQPPAITPPQKSAASIGTQSFYSVSVSIQTDPELALSPHDSLFSAISPVGSPVDATLMSLNMTPELALVVQQKPSTQELVVHADEPDVDMTDSDFSKFARLEMVCEAVAADLKKGRSQAVYKRAMSYELQDLAVQHTNDEICPILYKGRHVGQESADIVISSSWLPFAFKIIASDAEPTTEDHIQCLNFMRAKGFRFGSVVNFNQHAFGSVNVQFLVIQGDCCYLFDRRTRAMTLFNDFGFYK
jgi:GxxExxY protein